MITVEQRVIERLKLLCPLIPGLDGGVIDPTEGPLSPPCMVVEDWLGAGPRQATRQRISSAEYAVTRTYLLVLVADNLCDTAALDEAEKIKGIRAARPWMETVPKFFLPLRLLSYNHEPLAGVREVSPMSDNGIDFITWAKRIWVAVQYGIDITTYEST
jgi:hypothetical protein